jgi:3-oxoacyl-[acyl-carrier-protein] synthase-1
VAALRQARAELDGGKTEVLLVGVDSLLNAADINFYLQEERLFVPGNTDGFLPGEAAAALIVSRTPASAGRLRIAGLGSGNEAGTLDGSVPNRSEGLTAAIRQACAEAHVAPAQLQFRLSDQNGEHFFTRDATNAITRVMAGGGQPAFLTLADKLGDIGAATGPAMLAWLSREMQHPRRSPGTTGLLHLANDAGLRDAVVLQSTSE